MESRKLRVLLLDAKPVVSLRPSATRSLPMNAPHRGRSSKAPERGGIFIVVG